MKPILVQYNGEGLGDMGGKSFSKSAVRELPPEFASQCDGETWVNLNAQKEETPAKNKPTSPTQTTPLKDPSVGDPSQINGISEDALSEIFAGLPDFMANPENLIGSGAPDVKALEQASGYNLNASLRDDLYGYYLELQSVNGAE